MDQARFDALARALGNGMSRRGALLAALTALPTAGALAQTGEPDGAKKKRKRCRKDSPEGQCCTNKKGCACDNGGVVCGVECCAVGGSCTDGACAATGCSWTSDVQSWGGRLLRGVTADFFEVMLFVGLEYEGKVAWAKRGISDEWVWQEPWIGTGATGPQRNYRVSGLAMSAADELFIVDQVKGRVAVWMPPSASNPAWTFGTAFGDAGGGTVNLKEPIGIALSADSRTVFVTEQGGVSIYRRSAADQKDWAFAGRLGGDSSACGLGSFKRPYGVALAASNLALIVSDCDAVQVWTRPNQGSDDWQPVIALSAFGAGDRLRGPLGVSVAAVDDHSFWVVDAGGTRVVEWVALDGIMSQWTVRTIFGSRGKGAGQFMEPIDIHAGVSGTVWVTDIESYQADRRILETWTGCGA